MAMMTKMREKTHIVLGFLLVAFLALIVVEWGSESTIFRSKQQSGVITSINGQDIHYEQFARAFEQQIEQYKQQSGQELQDSQLDYLRNQVWENMVREVLVTQEIQKRGIKAGDKEIVHYIFNEPPDIIKQNPSFQNEQGQFDNAKYQAALNDANMNETWRRVEDYMRATLPYQKFQDEFDAAALVTDAEVRDDYVKRNQKATVRYVFFNPENYRQKASGQIPVEKSAAEKYYQEHQDEFKEAEKRKIDYVIFSNKATHADSAAVRSLSEQILQRARSGEDFTALAGTYSEDESNRDKGGDLGFFKRGTMVKPFEDAAFGANPGDIIGPVETTFGLHIIKVVGRKFEEPVEDAANKDKTDKKKKGEKAKGEEMVQASHVLLKYKASRQTIEAARDSASYFAAAAKEAGWDAALKTEKMTAQTSQPFAKGSGFVPGVGMKPAVASYVFRSEAGTMSEPLDVPQGFIVLRVAESQKERIRPLEEVQAQIENTLRTDKLKNLAFAAAKAARAKLTGSMTLEDLAAQDSLEIKTLSEALTRAGFNRDIGRDAAFVGTAFSLQPNQISPAVKGARGAYLIQLLTLEPVNETDLQSQKESIRSNLVDRARQNAFAQWYTDLKEKAAIKDFRELYF